MGMKLPCGNQSCYLDRLPERLVVDGYRYWMAGYDTGSIAPWELAWGLFAEELGPGDGRTALSALSCWVRTCRTWSLAPCKFFPFQCKRLCREECLAVSLISALQHQDDAGAEFCLSAMIHPQGRDETIGTADGLADSLANLGQTLMPVPIAVIEDITNRPAREQFSLIVVVPGRPRTRMSTFGGIMSNLSFNPGRIFAVTCLLASVAMAPASANEAVLSNYADIALAGYEDSLKTAKALDAAIDTLIAKPSEASLLAARAAWIKAREPYQQTEVYRFGNAIVDDWEGKVNAWPLDEGLIDYVDKSYGSESDENALYTVNVIANPSLTVNGVQVDAGKITPELLSKTLHEAEEVEANVATGYHAIEFLLWGQDLNGTGPGAGKRPATDFDTAKCSGGNCDRRTDYLKAASTLLVTDLEAMVANWQPDGDARKALMADKNAGIAAILTGMGSLSYGELAGERMKLGLLLNDPEEEHDCFSDNTHNSHYFDQIGIRNVYTGHYRRIDGSIVKGPSVSELVAKADPALDAEIREKLDATVGAMAVMKARAESVESYDQMIGEGNEVGNGVVQSAIDALIDQTRSIERAVAKLGLAAIEFEGSDSLDNPNEVFQ